MIKSELPQDYWNNYLDELNRIINRSQERLTSDKFPKDRINYVGRGLASNYLKLTIAHYTFSKKMEVVRKSILEVIKYTQISWEGFWKLKNSKGEVLNQYILSAYDEMLWILSISYLVMINDSEFKKIVDVIDKDNIKDDLFEFIIKGKIPTREYSGTESYEEHFAVPNIFEKLRRATKLDSKKDAEVLIKEFLEKDWYKKHKDAGWYNSHKSKNNIYFGYWSFESAAITCIMDLDDNSYRDNEFYPKDLVDFYKEKK
jgi:hypothetical protein